MDLGWFVAPFTVGLLGSVHCVGMCGGIVAALSQVPAVRRGPAFPVPVTVAGAPAGAATAPRALHMAARTLSYNAGRIGSYAVAGAIAGGAIGGVRTLAQTAAWQQAAFVLANLMLVGLGLYLAGLWQGAARIESLGMPLWRRIQPLTTRIGPMGTTPRMFVLGALWGWLPCGMVYSMLLTAMLAGSPLRSALTMAAFGAGTLPVLLAAGMMGARLRPILQRRGLRLAGGLLVTTFGVLGLLRAFAGHHAAWLDAICIGGAA